MSCNSIKKLQSLKVRSQKSCAKKQNKKKMVLSFIKRMITIQDQDEMIRYNGKAFEYIPSAQLLISYRNGITDFPIYFDRESQHAILCQSVYQAVAGQQDILLSSLSAAATTEDRQGVAEDLRKGCHEPGVKQESLHAVTREDTIYIYLLLLQQQRETLFISSGMGSFPSDSDYKEPNLPSVGPTTLQLHGF